MIGDDPPEGLHERDKTFFTKRRDRRVPIASLAKERVCALFSGVGLQIAIETGRFARGPEQREQPLGKCGPNATRSASASAWIAPTTPFDGESIRPSVKSWLDSLTVEQNTTIRLFATDMHEPFKQAIRDDPTLAHAAHDPRSVPHHQASR